MKKGLEVKGAAKVRKGERVINLRLFHFFETRRSQMTVFAGEIKFTTLNRSSKEK